MPDSSKRVLMLIIKTLLIAVGIFLLVKLVGYAVPFLIAFVLSSLIEPLVRAMKKWLKLPRKIGSFISILLVLGTIGTLLAFLINRLITEVKNVYEMISSTSDSIAISFEQLVAKISNFYIQLPVEVSDAVDKLIADLGQSLQNLLGPIAKGTLDFAFSLPQVLIFIVVTLLATFFMSSDRSSINRFLEAQIPTTWLQNGRNLTGNMFKALFGWLRAQMILMSVTFSEVLVGMLLIGIENPLLVAMLVALVDVLPVLGTGTVLVPWGIISLAMGNTRVGISILLLYVICLFVRQLIEPKVVGSQIGIHPLLTLFSMYLGLQLLGVAGMIIGPITILILKSILEGMLKTEGFKGWLERYLRIKPLDPITRTPDRPVEETGQPVIQKSTSKKE